ncbi:MAG: hypothetical protein FWD73_14085 [Polyangiaceae bacterium]|nr:hypothetical protein [Polyangiaceae bacterium]
MNSAPLADPEGAMNRAPTTNKTQSVGAYGHTPLRIVIVVVLLLVVLSPRGAVADDAGVDDAGADTSSTDADAGDASDEGGDSEVPLACDGGLCDTTVGSTTCAMPQGKVDGAPVAAAACTALAAVISRRFRRPSRRQPMERGR